MTEDRVAQDRKSAVAWVESSLSEKHGELCGLICVPNRPHAAAVGPGAAHRVAWCGDGVFTGVTNLPP